MAAKHLRTDDRELELALRYSRRRLDIDELTRLYSIGFTVTVLAQRFQTTRKTISARLKAAGVVMRYGRRPRLTCHCGKPKHIGALCRWHARLANARRAREWKRKQFGIPKQRWRAFDSRVMDFKQP